MTADHPLVALCKAHGNNASDVRDAAHEIYHAQAIAEQDWTDWDREVVHAHLVGQFARAELWLHELKARAVEQLVCKHFDYDCGPLSKWVHISAMEAIKFGMPYADHSVSMSIAEDLMEDDAVIADAQHIINLAEKS